ncbi:transcriptional regulator with XRE-family HTH domain [Bradyrhizobium sp. USDA 4341]
MTESDTRKRLGQQLARARRARSWPLSQVSRRTGRPASRISEMETGAVNSTVDMLADAGATLGMSLVFIPNERMADVMKLLGEPAIEPTMPIAPVPSVFDDAFVDDTLPDEEEPTHARPK